MPKCLLDEKENYYSISYLIVKNSNDEEINSGLVFHYTKKIDNELIKINNNEFEKILSCFSLYYFDNDGLLKEKFWFLNDFYKQALNQKLKIEMIELIPSKFFAIKNNLLLSDVLNEFEAQKGWFWKLENLFNKKITTAQWIHKLLFLSPEYDYDRSITTEKLKDLIKNKKEMEMNLMWALFFK